VSLSNLAFPNLDDQVEYLRTSNWLYFASIDQDTKLGQVGSLIIGASGTQPVDSTWSEQETFESGNPITLHTNTLFDYFYVRILFYDQSEIWMFVDQQRGYSARFSSNSLAARDIGSDCLAFSIGVTIFYGIKVDKLVRVQITGRPESTVPKPGQTSWTKGNYFEDGSDIS
jgi:hypothetical protein